ncbi:hypothetical protein G3O06_31485 [Burkholderia sp. Ac-20345]|uniref:hypothetical protein n=1 Tax=Burkholderia sp. Ac-20345 TaxID=2703891 RepID=UPI00197BC6E6|nr:hypothetical protein [Burkholderia sp. Ac-20345]MBN3782026.1 hypothetical protein [Burkholderia sp. Ac-20345]
MNTDQDKKPDGNTYVTFSQAILPRGGNPISNYQKLLDHPTAGLVGHMDDNPHSAHVAILGYN